MKSLHDSCKIKVKIFLEDPDVMQRRLIDASAHSAADLTGHGVAVLMSDQKARQIVMPEISVKAVISGLLQKKGNAVVQLFSDFLTAGIQCGVDKLTFSLLDDLRHFIQQLLIFEVPIKNTLLLPHRFPVPFLDAGIRRCFARLNSFREPSGSSLHPEGLSAHFSQRRPEDFPQNQ